jgi:hypothetical protein
VGPCQGGALSLSAEWGPALSSEPFSVVWGPERGGASIWTLEAFVGHDPKAARRGAGYRARLRVLGCSFSHLVSKRRVGARLREGREELLLKEISGLV